jgi:hypothetical protein
MFNLGFGLHPNQGRGAPEIDILEIMATQWKWGGKSTYIPAYISTSLQISPGTPWTEKTRPETGWPYWGYMNGSSWRPTNWYEDLLMGPNGVVNEFYGRICGDLNPNAPDSYVADTISVNTPVNESLWDTFHTYRLEWQPEGYIEWYLDDEFLFAIRQESLTNKTGALISVEPMYLIANIALGMGWGIDENCVEEGVCMGICDNCMDCQNPQCECGLPEVRRFYLEIDYTIHLAPCYDCYSQGMKNCDMFPAEMEIDYIRVYQNKQDLKHTLGCSPPKYPTAAYIQAHKGRYENWTPQRSPYEGFGALGPTSPANPHNIYFFASAVLVFMGCFLTFLAYLQGNTLFFSLTQKRRRIEGYAELPSSSISY